MPAVHSKVSTTRRPVSRPAFHRAFRAVVLLATLLSGTACSSFNAVKNELIGGSAPADGPERLSGFIGAVVADEPRAALAGRDVLALGGNAADAAVAVGFTLAVTLPSRAGLGSGGACLAYAPDRSGPGQGSPEAILFTPVAAQGMPAGADRPAAVPMLPRGLFALHARYGTRPFDGLLAGPEQMARFGVPVSRALVRDIALVAGPLSQDPNARAVFVPGGKPLAEGDTLQQPDLGASISAMRVAGVGDLYQGGLARKLADASRLAGGPLTVAEMRAALPKVGGALVVPAGRDQAAFLPPPADGGLAAAAAFQSLQNAPNDNAAAQARAAGALLRYRAAGALSPDRAVGGDVRAILAAAPSGGTLPPMPASTAFTVLDRNGNAVTCALTMDNLFGTGRIAPGTGILLAASPSTYGLPMLAAGLIWNSNVHAFRAMAGGSGQEGAALAVAVALNNALRSNQVMPVPVPDPGRANVMACSRYLPDSDGTCGWTIDPREAGLAAAGN
jgi:gamma-glutamyltranspeptidase/glutathione hydrolase